VLIKTEERIPFENENYKFFMHAKTISNRISSPLVGEDKGEGGQITLTLPSPI
jgi:hypothetical protein